MSVSNRKLTWAQRQTISYDGGARDQLNQSNVGGRSVAKGRWKVRERWGLKEVEADGGRRTSQVRRRSSRITSRQQLFIKTEREVVWRDDCDKWLLFLWTTRLSKQEVAESETGSRKLLARMICAHWLWSTSREQQQTRTWNCVWVYQCVLDCMCVCVRV